MADNKPSTWSTRRNRIILLFVSITITLILIELLLRSINKFEPEPVAYVGEYTNRSSQHFVADPETGWRMRPQHQFSWTFDGVASAYRSNSQGFRSNSEFDLTDRRKKIVLVGDSFTFGAGVEYDETYGARLESQLTNSVVYNLAMPGFGIDQMWLSVRHQALALRPSLIIVGFIDDDFDRSMTAYRPGEGFNKPTFILRNGRVVAKEASDGPNGLLRLLNNHSRAWFIGRVAYRRLAYRIAIGEWLSLNQAILQAIQADCAEKKVKVLFVRMQRKGRPKEFYTLRSFMDRIGANYLDQLDHGPTLQDIWFATDDHMNAKGNRQIAEIILEWCRKNMPEL